MKKRLYFIIFAFSAVAIATVLLLSALDEDIVYFFSPTEVVERMEDGKVKLDQQIRIGGLVKVDSVDKTTSIVTFIVTDTKTDLNVEYEGILPDLFRENQGVVIEGKMLSNTKFKATEVLAKHDENYMSKEVKDGLEKQGYFKHTEDEDGKTDAKKDDALDKLEDKIEDKLDVIEDKLDDVFDKDDDDDDDKKGLKKK